MSSTTPDKNENYQQIVQTICKELKELDPKNDALTESSDLTTDVHIDSASTMMLVFTLEEKFDVSVPLNELGNVRTIEDLAGLIQKLQ